MCQQIADAVLSSVLWRVDANTDPEQLREAIDSVVAEFTELERSIFQGSQHATTVSFTLVCTTMWGRIAKSHADAERLTPDLIKTIVEPLNSEDTNVSYFSESQMVELKKKLDRGFRRMKLQSAKSGMETSWGLGFFGSDLATMDFCSAHDGGAAGSSNVDSPRKVTTQQPKV